MDKQLRIAVSFGPPICFIKFALWCHPPTGLGKGSYWRDIWRHGSIKIQHNRCRRLYAPVVWLCLIAACVPSQSYAASLTDLLGVNQSIDKAVLGMQAIVDQARDAAFAIEAQTNKDVTDRLNQVDAIVEKTISEVKALEAQTFADADALVASVNALILNELAQVSALEKKFVSDLALLIDQAECKVDLSVNEALKDALGGVGKFLGTNRIEVTPPVMYAGERKSLCVPGLQNCEISRTFALKTPFSATYFEIRDYLIGRLDGARDDTPIESVVSTYQYIAELAKRTGCFMRGSESTYDEDFVFYITKARQWQIVTRRR